MARRGRLKIRSAAELRRLARAEVGEEIRSETGGLRTESRQLTGRRRRALDELGKLYGGLQEHVRGSAERMTAAASQSYDAQRQLFEQAATRLDQFRQQRGADAQALAQQTGGPVPISAFTEGVDMANIAPHAAAGSLLEALALGQAGVGEQEAFAGRVFPLLQKEDTLETGSRYDEEISALQEEIARINASAGGRRTKRFNELLVAEREDELERLMADRDYQLGSRAADLGESQLAETRAGRRQEYSQWQQEMVLRREELYAQREDEAFEILDILAQGASGETVTTSEWQSVGDFKPGDQPAAAVLLPGRSNIPNSNKKRYYKLVNVKQNVGSRPPILDPNVMFKTLRSMGYERAIAISLIRQYFDLGGSWKPAKK